MLAHTKANADLDALYGSGTPATFYIALFSSAPSADGTGGTELSGGSYARKAVTNNATNFPAASGASKSNGVDITFAAASAPQGTATHVVITDALSGGNRYDWGPLTAARTIGTGDQVNFAPGQLEIKY